MTDFFEFEADFVDSLRCIPMLVRYKLDTCGIKLKLAEWNEMNQESRQKLIILPCATDSQIHNYRDYIQQLVLKLTGKSVAELPIEPNPPWLDITNIPRSVDEKAQEIGIIITIEAWKNLTILQRFVLIKLSRPSHENKNFLPALVEFNLLPKS
ncbi:nitrate reductase associated protein [Dolichospermum circinale CS-1225]|uniref:Nitrate reductase associated protein n=1 Tax=Dolichospermum circinale CS-537/01 TaxID=3021739 RepID=A0ABT5A3E2_9CYAN|nr:nitrate reductase associated protein [Dolichospermum circinale]MDB9459600.1 nitrate reductase associated protein [Dolichospermum circinale CS-545/17]MDB9486453.1 nitrate reductase associated protein [Dolichospermum circinale CS-537/01]MDB9520686.1 nitrate reductase associated protein [Dolichospermum circinale CS-1225]